MSDAVSQFIQQWKSSGASERANYQLFLTGLCELLELPRPEPSRDDDALNAYVFERRVKFAYGDGSSSNGFIDLYKRGCFILEAKQGSEKQADDNPLLAEKKKKKAGTAIRGTAGWDDAMYKARGQAESYAKALPVSEGWPPLLVVVDVGHCIEVYAEFSCSGKTYTPFPDPAGYRIRMDDLTRPEIQERLKLIWTEPLTLDPARRSAKVTRELAERLGLLAKSLEQQHSPDAVAQFLMRCLFTMFAEDVELLPAGSFTGLLESFQSDLPSAKPMLEHLWQTMNTGGFSPILRTQVKHFNGGLFASCEALPLDAEQLRLLIQAGKADWREVEPAIFGTLLERALSPRDRHKLGAHYTPRAYVERLVQPTIIDPLRQEWKTTLAAAALESEKKNGAENARKLLRDFHAKLCNLKILDPACGCGNFLYVTLELMKRLEGEVVETLKQFGEAAAGSIVTVDPDQFLGLEINPRAVAITDLVLWIGYLQWHFRSQGQDVLLHEPIISKFKHIQEQDAVLACDGREPLLDEQGQPVTRWDGRTTKTHPVTGQEVPDETARIPVYRYLNPRPADWPAADYIIGNPPFIGTARMRDALGDGYTESIRAAYRELPESCDFVMYWWHKAAEKVRSGEAKRFGFIATNSLRQTFNRRVIEPHLAAKYPLSLLFAIPDHPWVDTVDGAAVRISMTAGQAGELPGLRQEVIDETPQDHGESAVELQSRAGKILPDLTIGPDVAGSYGLQANQNLSNRGVCLFGAGFIVTPDQAASLGLGSKPGYEQVIRQYLNGRDLNQKSRGVMVIDLFGYSADEARDQFPEVYQWVYERVKPERNQNNRASRKENWWLFGETNPKLRNQLAGLPRYIATVETSKHRFFVFLDAAILPDNMLVNIALSDAYHLGVLSSRLHVVWALAAGGRLGVGNDPRYNKSRCFAPFPFPDPTDAQRERIRELGERLDGHRKRQQAQHPELTMTGMYNVLEKLRAGEALTDKERIIHEQGLASILQEIHDELDAAVAAAYAWPVSLTDEEILERLVALNAERAAEEARGLVRWLRPEYQNPQGTQATEHQPTLPDADGEEAAEVEPARKLAWPKTAPERFLSVLQCLNQRDTPGTAEHLARHFERAQTKAVEEILNCLVSLGQARQLDDGRYSRN